jgi:hypothetical protein
MSFIELDDAFAWKCDSCGKIAAFPPSDFYGRKDELKERGWTFHLDEEGGGRTWTHYCAYCNHKRRQTSMMDRTFSKPREVKG